MELNKILWSSGMALLLGTAACWADDAADRLQAHVKTLSVDLSPRSHEDLKNLNACATYIGKQLEASGATVRFQKFTVEGRIYQNVRAVYGDVKKPRWVIGAHYDAHEETPGADDNASGVAGLIELGKRLGSEKEPPSVELVAYTLEEPPYFGTSQMGSYRHAKFLSDEKIEVTGMLALEMIGYFNDKSGSQLYPLPSMKERFPDKGNFIAVVSRMDQKAFTERVHAKLQNGTDLPLEVLNAPQTMPGIAYSDHRNYWPFGFPAAMLTDTAFMRNFEYHRKGDTHDRLDYERMNKVVDGVFHLLTE